MKKYALDGRSPIDVLHEERLINENTVIGLNPVEFTDYKDDSFNIFKNTYPIKGEVPLGSIPNVNSIYCEEDEGWHIEKTDKYGFFNTNNQYTASIDFLLIGDSAAQGGCTLRHTAYWLRKNYNTITLGQGGNGTLIGYASLKEFIRKYKSKQIIWYVVSNDLIDTRRELKNNFLRKNYYVENKTLGYFEDSNLKILNNYRKNVLDIIPEYLNKNMNNIIHNKKNRENRMYMIITGGYIKVHLKKYLNYINWKKKYKPADKSKEKSTYINKTGFYSENNQVIFNIQKDLYLRAWNDLKNTDQNLIFLFMPGKKECQLGIHEIGRYGFFGELKNLFNEKNIKYINGYDLMKNFSCKKLFAQKKGGHLTSFGYQKLSDLILQ